MASVEPADRHAPRRASQPLSLASVVAAGVLITAAAALIAGTSGVRVGTRFVAAAEADAHPLYLEQLITARAEDTVYTQAFSTNWPNAPHRVLRSCVAAAEAFDGEVVGETLDLAGVRERVRRFDCLAVTRATTGRIEAMSLWAGEAVGAVKRAQPAADVLRELVEEATLLLESSGVARTPSTPLR